MKKGEPGFTERTTRYMQAAAKASETWYDANGRWVADSMPAATRERYWQAFALYATGRAQLADAVVRLGDTTEYHGIKFNIFDSNIAAALLAQHRARIGDDVRPLLEHLVSDSFSFRPGNRQPDYQFHGYNDNMPSKGTMGLILGGEMMGDDEAVAYGVWSLRQMRAMLRRRGVNSEYNSPTYSPLTIHAMGEIATHTRNEEARDLALAIEGRLWLDLAARFHPAMGVVAGPYSRAYTVDVLAHQSILASLLWFVLGDIARPSPMELFAEPCDLTLHHMGDRPFNICQMVWFAAGSYHVPEQAMDLFHRKKLPFRAVATAEMGDMASDQPGRPTRIESVLLRDFTVGTSDTPFLGGGASYFVTYRRREQIESFRDIGTVFHKMILDDDEPGHWCKLEAPPINGIKRHYSNEGEEDFLNTEANSVVIQAGTTVLSLSHPRVVLGKGAEHDRPGFPATPPRAIRRLSDVICFPCHFGEADEVIVGGRQRGSWTGSADAGEWIVCRRGKLMIAIRPLSYSRHFGKAKITLERVNRYDMLRMTIYDGPAREFTQGELKLMFGGFVAEHASTEDWPSLAAFAQAVSAGKVSDYFFLTRRVRYRREPGTFQNVVPHVPTSVTAAISASDPGTDIELSWSPGSTQPRYATIDGRPIDWPIVAIDGVPDVSLPIMNEPFHPVPPFFPWKDFRVEWGDWAYAIGDNQL